MMHGQFIQPLLGLAQINEIQSTIIMKLVLKNVVLFKLGWLACVLGAANGFPWMGPVAVLLIAGEHLRTSQDWGPELALLSVAALVGLLWESALVAFGFLEYGVGMFAPGFAPYWIVAMWVLFATTLNVGMKWLKKHWMVASIAGGISGPMAFFAGERAGAVVFSDAAWSLVAIGVGWAILLPLMTRVAQHLNGHTEQVVVSEKGASHV